MTYAEAHAGLLRVENAVRPSGKAAVGQLVGPAFTWSYSEIAAMKTMAVTWSKN